MRAPLFALAATLAALATPAQADPLQDQVLGGMRAANSADVGFTQTTRVERTGSAAKDYVTRYDPRAPAASRWSLVRVDGRAPTVKETREVLKGTGRAPLPGYARLAKWFGGPATRVAQGPGSVTYRFARLPAGTIKIGSHDASADTIVDAVVNTGGRVPYVERVRMTSSAPFRMMMVAKVDGFVFTSSYGLLPDGRPFPTGNDADMTGSMLGKSGSFKTRTRYTDVRATR